MYKALTFAGSDTSGGAGLQADLKTFQERDVYGMVALTTIVTMDPDNNWSHGVFPVELSTIREQLKTSLKGIGVDAMKTGMLATEEIIKLAVETIDTYDLKNVIVDPVMVCKGADEAVFPEVNNAIRDLLVPKALVVTPNLFEASQLAGMAPITTIEEMKEAAQRIQSLGVKYVLVKGGSKLQGTDKALDVLYDGNEFEILEGEKIEGGFTHGAGCTISACITAEIAKGNDVKEAIYTAKKFITAAIKHSFPLNQYVGPTRHSALRVFGEE
jgi:pyridoxine kinase